MHRLAKATAEVSRAGLSSALCHSSHQSRIDTIAGKISGRGLCKSANIVYDSQVYAVSAIILLSRDLQARATLWLRTRIGQMDGITVLSLAVNIIQVVVWGRQAIDVLKGGEIYQTQRDAATNFQSATGSLQKQLSLQPQPITAEDQSLLQTVQTCETAADKLLKELGPTDDANRLKLPMNIRNASGV